MVSAHEKLSEVDLRIFTDVGLMSQPHFHKSIELVYVTKGSVETIADGKRCKANSGDLFVCFPNQVHYYENCEYGEYKVFILDTKFVYGFREKTHHKKPKTNILKCDERIKTVVSDVFAAQEKGNTIASVAGICLLISEFLSKAELVERDKYYDRTLRDIIQFCDCNFSNEINLDFIANNLNLSKYYISHTINKKLGMSYSQYINSLRITEAVHLIREDIMTLAEISEQVGFGTVRNFNLKFKEFTSYTPSEYKKLTMQQERES